MNKQYRLTLNRWICYSVLLWLYTTLLVLYPNILWSLNVNVYWANPGATNTPTCSAIKSTGTADAPGSDPGSYGSINGAANCATVAGDVVNIKAGTYAGAHDKIVLNGETTGLASGTSESVRTFLQGDPSGAVPVLNLPNWFTMKDEASSSTRSYITIRNLYISGSGGGDGGGADMLIEGKFITVDNVEMDFPYNHNIAAFRATSGSTGIDHLTIKNSKLHGQAGDGNGYCLYLNADDVLVERNECYHKKGGGFQIFDTTTSLRSDRSIIRYNYLHDFVVSTQAGFSGCFGIAVDGNDALVHNNLITDGSTCTAQAVNGGYDNLNVLKAYNNTIYNFNGLGIGYGLFNVTTGNLIKNNLLPGHSITNASNNGSTATLATNRTAGVITDCTVSTSDFSQVAGSACLNAGTAITGFPYNDTAPDQGAFEKITFASCVVENGDAGTLRVTFNNGTFPPLFPTTGITGFTARKAGANDAITAAALNGTNKVYFTLTNAIANGEAVDFSHSGPGNLTDSANIGKTLVQSYNAVVTNQSCTNNVGVGTAALFTQAKFRFNGLRGTEAAPVATPYAAAPANTDILIVPGGSVRLRIGLTCTIADCPPTGFLPRYSLDGGAYMVVPDTFVGGQEIGMCGTSPDPDIPTQGTIITQQLSLSGVFAAGAFVRTSNAIPTIDMALNGNSELEYCFSWSTVVGATHTYQFKLYQQDGTILDGYTVVPKVTITPSQAGRGF